MSFKTQTDGGLLIYFHVHLARVRLPEQLHAFWPDLNSEDGPRGPGTAPELRAESGRLPILTKL